MSRLLKERDVLGVLRPLLHAHAPGAYGRVASDQAASVVGSTET